MGNYKISKCNRCDRKIIWATNRETGKLIPLDAVAPTYMIVFTHTDGRAEVKPVQSYVSHFNTCAYANTFSKAAKPAAATPEPAPEPEKPIPSQVGLFEDQRNK